MDIQIIKREMERVPWQHLPLHRLSEKTQRALHTNAAIYQRSVLVADGYGVKLA